HAVRGVPQLLDVRRLEGLGETRPAASGFEFVGGSEQRLTRDDIDVDPRLVVVQVFAGPGRLGAALLGYAILRRGEPGDHVRVLSEFLHYRLLEAQQLNMEAQGR